MQQVANGSFEPNLVIRQCAANVGFYLSVWKTSARPEATVTP